jgi:hypothetical protein
MKLKFGMIVTDGRNKLGGHVLSKNRAGAYARTKVTPVNPRSSYQSNVRSLFTSLSQAWRGLSQDARTAWNNAVANYQRTDIFGDLKSPSGFNLYQRLNNVLATISGAPLTNPPLPDAVPDCHIISVTATVGSPSLSVILNDSVPTHGAVKVFATPPLSPGKSFVKNQFRLISVLAPEASTPFNALSAYTAKYGNLGEIGQKIIIQTVACNFLTGQEGTPAQASVITAA